MKNLKIIIIATFISISLGAMLIGGFTAAKFISVAQASAGAFVSGDMEVTLDHPEDVPYFNLTNIAPGDHDSTEIVVSNTGTIDMDYVLNLNISGGLAEGEHPLVFLVYDNAGNSVDLMSKRTLSAGEQEVLIIEWQMPEEAGNEYQNATAQLDIRVIAEQRANSIVDINL